MKSTQYDYTNHDSSENIITYKVTTLVNLNVTKRISIEIRFIDSSYKYLNRFMMFMSNKTGFVNYVFFLFKK
ncbi:hypothetical protein DSM106972_082450 [Dulcicalothrix desertica PCC 7102]|uniref:Uncharacterized protein n=1 Tax=Dulcicalothrix desertica PCC 7102 TaxID=232991 RepID=A0A3S1C7U2_9CYAN|nr:hypothetical protein DSM106972_082450 [Dulcicalothrix desertica PCC 7102]